MLSLEAGGCLSEALLVRGVRGTAKAASLKFTLDCLEVYRPKLLLQAVLGHRQEHLYSAEDQTPQDLEALGQSRWSSISTPGTSDSQHRHSKAASQEGVWSEYRTYILSTNISNFLFIWFIKC